MKTLLFALLLNVLYFFALVQTIGNAKMDFYWALTTVLVIVLDIKILSRYELGN